MRKGGQFMKIEGRTVNRWLVTAATIGALAAGALGFSAPASAAGGTQIEHFLITGNFQTDANEHFVAHGAFTGGGVAVPRNSSELLKFGNGRLVLKHPNSAAHFTFRINPDTCFVKITGTGSYTLGNGTGAYANVTGSGTYKYNAQAVTERNPDGSCNDSAPPRVEVFYVNASGPVSLGG
jgi:hypothetical protein